jgi:hypothetical protein
MKKTSQPKIQSSVPVQHSHTGKPQQPQQSTLPNTDDHDTPPPTAPVTDHRLPIDAEARKHNRTLPTAEVVDRLALIPTAAKCAQVVGAWVWVQFAAQPAAEIRQQLAQLGFHWNRTRQAWQHPCGKFSTAARATDPRDTYASKPAMEAFA